MPTYRVIAYCFRHKKYTQYLGSRVEYLKSKTQPRVFLTVHETNNYESKICFLPCDVVLIEKL